MTKGQLEINSQNILPIIKKWLYTDKDIFIRELISNACDAISKRQRLSGGDDMVECDEAARIDVIVDKEAKTITFKDNGIGMTEDEIVRYLSQVAFSSAQEFIERFEEGKREELIGNFGLGFYSAFMVASNVTVHSKSALKESTAVTWICNGESEYEVNRATKETVGTEIILDLIDDEYLDEAKLASIMRTHCQFLPYEIYSGEERINPQEPLWDKKPSQVSEEEYLAFYRYLYPHCPDPMFWVHLDVDYPFHLKGILYFPKIDQSWQQNKHTISLYCRRVFVSDNCSDILPDYLTVLHGAIDSPDIPLNVSRSALQKDSTVKQLSGHISKKVADKLKSLFKSDRAQFEASWPQIEGIIKYGIHEDDKFYERASELVLWKSLSGEYKTLEELKELSLEGDKKRIYYIFGEQKNAPMTQLYLDKGLTVVIANPVIDPPTMSLIESKEQQIQFCRCDGNLDETMLDKEREETILNADGRTKGALLADFARAKLSDITGKVSVEVKSLTRDDLPALLVIDENQRRMRDWFARQQMDGGSNPLAESFESKLILNSNNSVVKAIDTLREKKPELAGELITEVHGLAALSQGELNQEQRQSLCNKTFELLSKMTQMIN